MYPRNAASPERLFIGTVVQISDGAVQTSGVTITVRKQGAAEATGDNSAVFGASGAVYYTPSQTETDTTSFVVIASKTGCIPVGITVVTTASAVAGYAGLDWATINAPTTTQVLSGTTVGTITTYTGNTPQTGDSYARIGANGASLTSLASAANLATVAGYLDTEIADIQARLPAALVGGRMDANVGAISSDSTAADNAEAFFDGTGYAGTNNVIPLVTTTTTATNLTNLPTIPANWLTAAGIATGAFTATKFAAGAIDAAALATDAVAEIAAGVGGRTMSELTGDPGATPTADQAAMLNFMAIRNKRDTDSGLGTDEIHNNAGSVILTATISDAAGVFSKAKYA